MNVDRLKTKTSAYCVGENLFEIEQNFSLKQTNTTTSIWEEEEEDKKKTAN